MVKRICWIASKEALNQVKGGFAYLLLTEDAMIAALDPNGFRPLSLGKMVNGAYVIASETCALEVIGAEFVRDICPGEVVIVDQAATVLKHIRKKSNQRFAQWNSFILHDQIRILPASMSILHEKIWDVILPKKHRSKQIW